MTPVESVRLPSPDEVERRIREKAAEEGRGIDAVDAFLINMSRMLGIEATDRFIGGGHV
jgi:hypothetical protein